MQLKVNPELCTGCRMCEMECSNAHEQLFGTAISRIRVSKLEQVGIDYPVVCQQCVNAPCVAACPEDALHRTPAGTIALDASRCRQCGACVEACPFGAMNLHPKTGLPLSCDLCGGTPSCVAGCPTGALTYAEDSKLDRKRFQELADIARSKRDAYAERMTKKLAADWGEE